MEFKDIFSQRLQTLRKSAGENQEALGAVVGIGKTGVSEMENGRKTTTAEKIALICRHYNVTADYLLGLTDCPRPLNGEEPVNRDV